MYMPLDKNPHAKSTNIFPLQVLRHSGARIPFLIISPYEIFQGNIDLEPCQCIQISNFHANIEPLRRMLEMLCLNSKDFFRQYAFFCRINKSPKVRPLP